MSRTTPSQRHDFYRRHLQGATYQEIADGANVSYECIRYWCRRQRDGGSCQSRYTRSSPGLLSTFAPLVRYVILRLKLAHPRWGPERIHFHLARRRSCQGLRLPHRSSIGRYLHQWPRFQRKPKVKPMHRKRPRPVTQVHERWQLDFKTNIEQANGQKLTLHTLMDEYSGACIEAQLLPAEKVVQRRARITWREAQATLRCGFSSWDTRPQSVQTDGETTLTGRSGMDFPTDFTLWLTGLGVNHAIIRPGVSTDNAEVERGHRTVNDYAIVGQVDQPIADLQLMLHHATHELAFELPSRAKACHGHPPVTAYPALQERPMPYQLEHELALFDMQRIDALLATFQWQRKVNKNGAVQLGGHARKYSVGRQYAYEHVLVRFDAADRQMVFSLADDPDKEIGRKPIKGICKYDLVGLDDPEVSLVPQQLPLLPEVLKG